MIEALLRLLRRAVIPEDGGCWEVDPGKANIYPRTRIGKKHWYGSRLAYTLFNGRMKRRHECCHKCDNPKCINPSHLFAATHRENMLDRVRKGRHHNTKKTQCPKGHEYVGKDNRGHRMCRDCYLESQRKYREKKRAGN